MSQDGMVFEDVRYREPQRVRRPDRDGRWACLAYGVPEAYDLPVFLDRAAADAIERHSLRDTDVELGGILLGTECLDDVTGEPFVWVTKSLEAKHYENTQASFTYTHDSWEEITRDRDRLYPDLDIVGWYHTHPDFGIFLSSHDLFIHHHFFAQPLQVAYVVDPLRQTRGFFRWKNGQMDQVGGFHLTADRGERAALARLVNDLENVPNPPETGGGGLSPRLEAELIAMLTRPVTHHPATSAPDRTQLATLFGLIGAALGVLGLGGVLWLNHLHSGMQEQTRAISELRKAVDDSAARQRLALDTVLDGAGGKSAEELLARYARASKGRDEAEQQLAQRAAIIDVLAAKTKAQGDDLVKLTRERDRYKDDAKDAQEAQHLRERVAELAGDNARQAQRIVELGGILDTVEGKKTEELAAKYQASKYAAVAGWSVSLILALATVAGYVLLRPVPPSDGDLSPPPGPEVPTHRIT